MHERNNAELKSDFKCKQKNKKAKNEFMTHLKIQMDKMYVCLNNNRLKKSQILLVVSMIFWSLGNILIIWSKK